MAVLTTTADETNFKKCLNEVIVGVASFNAAHFTTEDGNKSSKPMPQRISSALEGRVLKITHFLKLVLSGAGCLHLL